MSRRYVKSISHLALAASLIFALPVRFSATQEKSKSSITVSVCRIEYTKLGRSARFHFNYIYIVQTAKDGSVEKVTKVHGENYGKLMREDQILDCIKTWAFASSSKYIVTFSLGTSGDNFILITEPDGCSLKIRL